MKTDEINKIYSQYSDTAVLYGGVEDEYIEKAEKQLGVTFPDSFKWYLRKYGSGGVLGITISGVQRIDKPSVVRSTERFREFGLGNEYVVIEDCAEFAMCLDTSKMVDNECPVVSYIRHSTVTNQEYDNFYDFLLDELKEAIDNLDDEDNI